MVRLDMALTSQLPAEADLEAGEPNSRCISVSGSALVTVIEVLDILASITFKSVSAVSVPPCFAIVMWGALDKGRAMIAAYSSSGKGGNHPSASISSLVLAVIQEGISSSKTTLEPF